jgi:hypothetical protein
MAHTKNEHADVETPAWQDLSDPNEEPQRAETGIHLEAAVDDQAPARATSGLPRERASADSDHASDTEQAAAQRHRDHASSKENAS